MTKVLTTRFDLRGEACDIDVYIKTGGYQALPKAFARRNETEPGVNAMVAARKQPREAASGH